MDGFYFQLTFSRSLSSGLTDTTENNSAMRNWKGPLPRVLPHDPPSSRLPTRKREPSSGPLFRDEEILAFSTPKSVRFRHLKRLPSFLIDIRNLFDKAQYPRLGNDRTKQYSPPVIGQDAGTGTAMEAAGRVTSGAGSNYRSRGKDKLAPLRPLSLAQPIAPNSVTVSHPSSESPDSAGPSSKTASPASAGSIRVIVTGTSEGPTSPSVTDVFDHLPALPSLPSHPGSDFDDWASESDGESDDYLRPDAQSGADLENPPYSAMSTQSFNMRASSTMSLILDTRPPQFV